MTFLFAALDNLLSFSPLLIYAFAANPEFQNKARTEIDSILKDKKEQVIHETDIPSLDYTTMCIKEALRMYSPSSGFQRYTEKPFEIDGKSIPAGIYVQTNTWMVLHHPEIWKDPFVFDPTRFTKEEIKKRDPYAFIPFGAGPRKCIAQSFVLNNLKVFIARMLRNFEISVDPNYEFDFATSQTISAKTKIPLEWKVRDLHESAG